MILDADALTALATQPKTLPIGGRSLILTPHTGEMARLMRSQVKEVLEDRIGLSRNFSQSQHVHLVLKGHPTLISTPKGEVFINPTGNPGMASGGTGDVLTGMIGGLVCQGFDILPSLQIAVYLHGLAGDPQLPASLQPRESPFRQTPWKTPARPLEFRQQAEGSL